MTVFFKRNRKKQIKRRTVMEVKGYWTGYAYKGYVGKGVAGADANGYKEYENDHEYHVEIRENAKENANG